MLQHPEGLKDKPTQRQHSHLQRCEITRKALAQSTGDSQFFTMQTTMQMRAGTRPVAGQGRKALRVEAIAQVERSTVQAPAARPKVRLDGLQHARPLRNSNLWMAIN